MASPVGIVAPTSIELVDISLIDDSPDNIRGAVGNVDELAASIASRGLIHPPALTRENGRFRIVAGHRRVKALRKLGALKVPATIRATTEDREAIVDMIIENIQREGITPMQEAKAFRKLDELGLKQREIAKQVGCSQPHVSKRLSLTELPEAVQDAVDAGGIHVNDAVELLVLKEDPELLMRVFNNRGKAPLRTLIDGAKNSHAKVASEEVQKTEAELAAAKDAASRRRAVTKLVKLADFNRSKVVTSLLKGRFNKGKSLDFILQTLIDATPKTTLEMAGNLLNIKTVNTHGDLDIPAYLKENEEENSLRLAYAIALSYGHDPLLGGRKPLEYPTVKFARHTLDHLSTVAGYDANQGEKYLTGQVDLGEVEPPAPEVKPAKVTKDKKQAKKRGAASTAEVFKAETTTLPMSTNEDDPDGQAARIVCPECKGTGTNVDDSSEPCPICDGTGWTEPGTTED